MSRSTVLEVAKKELGTTEFPPNSNKCKYGAWYAPELNGQKWCAMFVSWVFDHAGCPLGFIQTAHGIHHCQSAYNYYKSKGLLTNDPQAGDIVIYDWEGNGHADHIGIFVRWSDAGKTKLDAYEGNTSVGNNSDGGMVMLRTRSRNLVKSFINPGVYGDEEAGHEEKVLRVGDRGSDVVTVQKYLYDLDYEIVADGWYGDQTSGAVKDFQQKNLMTVTGVVDAITKGSIEEEWNKRKVAKAKFVAGSYLKKGTNGFMVVALQRALNTGDAGLKLPITGIFDDATYKAVKGFQLKNNLGVDGIVGPMTFGKLGIE